MSQRVVAVSRTRRQESGVWDCGLLLRVRAENDQRAQPALFAVGVAGELERMRPLEDVVRRAAAVEPGSLMQGACRTTCSSTPR